MTLSVSEGSADTTPEVEAEPELVPGGGRWWSRVEETLAGLLLGAIGSVVTLGVFTRYALDAPVAWSEPLARYLLVWLTLIGGVVLVKHRGHIAIEFVADLLPRPARRVVVAFASLAQLLLFGFLAWFGWEFAMSSSSATTVPFITQREVYLAVPVGAVLMAGYTVPQLIQAVRGTQEDQA